MVAAERVALERYRCFTDIIGLIGVQLPDIVQRRSSQQEFRVNILSEGGFQKR